MARELKNKSLNDETIKQQILQNSKEQKAENYRTGNNKTVKPLRNGDLHNSVYSINR